jgi:hypothetical protein
MTVSALTSEFATCCLRDKVYFRGNQHPTHCSKYHVQCISHTTSFANIAYSIVYATNTYGGAFGTSGLLLLLHNVAVSVTANAIYSCCLPQAAVLLILHGIMSALQRAVCKSSSAFT